MSNRITQKDLENLVKRINEFTKNPVEYSIKETNPETGKTTFKSNVGHYCLDYAYGGVKLVQVVSEGGGIRTISTGGYGTKRELYHFMQGMLNGLHN